MAFQWKSQIRGVVFKYDDKLGDTFCDTYAVVLWRNPEPTPYTCIDFDHILNPNMLTNPHIYSLISVSVYEQKGYEDTEIIRTFYGRVLLTGSDKDLLRSLTEEKWCRLRELGVSNKELPIQEECLEFFCKINQNTDSYGNSASSTTNCQTAAHFPNTWSHPGIGYGWYSTNKSSAYPTTASTSHFSLTDLNYIGTSAQSTAAQYPSTTASTSHFPPTDLNFGPSASITSCADSQTHHSHTTNIVCPGVREGNQGSPKTYFNLDTPKSHNNSSFISSKEFEIVIKGLTKLTVLSKEMLQQLKNVNTRLSKLE
ncbi:hypothetical protein DAPPUDRAFT_326564 [Daphnia pulex]|uniref:Uncharacterized protein n=1 Tax=Daphnia pulex TaxID=6669 RepID=E9H845_DAPPU|nr:hypothetical protein DAPPUDRAFT_326564 [Daphnia pulex]|eukprot:EFX72007.1 hypothetical protein DAPPUDRAFT_326564 [Daphnia pulex]